jgi:hypothetical protein
MDRELQDSDAASTRSRAAVAGGYLGRQICRRAYATAWACPGFVDTRITPQFFLDRTAAQSQLD